MTKHMALLLSATALATMTASAAFADNWDMPMAYAAANYHSENGAEFARCVTDRSGGLEIITHPGGSLFNGADIKRAVQTGQASIGERLISAHAGDNPLYRIDSIPFVAASFEDSERLWRAAGDRLQAALAAENLIYVYSVPWPPQGIYTKMEINSIADLKDVKFRAYNPATVRVADLTGMIAVEVEAVELSDALADGVAESFISSASTGFERKVWEEMTHFYDAQAWLPRNVVFANKDAWEALDARAQGTLADCGAEAAARGLARVMELTELHLEGLAKNGMTVSTLPDQLEGELKGIGEIMTREWLEKAGETGKAIINAYSGM